MRWMIGLSLALSLLACKSTTNQSQVKDFDQIAILKPDKAICLDDTIYQIQKLGPDKYQITSPNGDKVVVAQTQIVTAVCPGDDDPDMTMTRFCGCKDMDVPGQQWPRPKIVRFTMAGGSLSEEVLTNAFGDDDDCQQALRQRDDCQMTGGTDEDLCSCKPFSFPWINADYHRGKKILLRNGVTTEVDITGYHTDYDDCAAALPDHPACDAVAPPDPPGPIPLSERQLRKGAYVSIMNQESFYDRCPGQVIPTRAANGELLKLTFRAYRLYADSGECNDGDIYNYTFKCEGQGSEKVCRGKSAGGASIRLENLRAHTFVRVYEGKVHTYGSTDAPRQRPGTPVLKSGLYHRSDNKGCSHKVDVFYQGKRLSHVIINRTDSPLETCTFSGQNVFACHENTPGSEVCTAQHGSQKRFVRDIFPTTYEYRTPNGTLRKYQIAD